MSTAGWRATAEAASPGPWHAQKLMTAFGLSVGDAVFISTARTAWPTAEAENDRLRGLLQTIRDDLSDVGVGGWENACNDAVKMIDVWLAETVDQPESPNAATPGPWYASARYGKGDGDLWQVWTSAPGWVHAVCEMTGPSAQADAELVCHLRNRSDGGYVLWEDESSG